MATHESDFTMKLGDIVAWLALCLSIIGGIYNWRQNKETRRISINSAKRDILHAVQLDVRTKIQRICEIAEKCNPDALLTQAEMLDREFSRSTVGRNLLKDIAAAYHTNKHLLDPQQQTILESMLNSRRGKVDTIIAVNHIIEFGNRLNDFLQENIHLIDKSTFPAIGS